MKRSILSVSPFIKCATAITFSAVVSTAITITTVQAQDLKEVVAASKEINNSANQSQQKINKIDEQIQSKLQKFKVVNKEVDGLNVYNKQMQAQLDNQLEELSNLAVSMEQVSIIERQISPLMARMIDTLTTFVSLDVPFLPEERSKRVTGLQSMLERADVAVSEKFRRVLEAYQVEVEYGRTIEAYSGLQMIDGQERDVDFLRIGRVSFIYQTRDGQQMGMWDQASKSWQPLDAGFRSDINKGLRIARKQLAPDLITVPVAQNSAE
ncbi:DUF3450 domain-containing protein [Thalassotalea profundi]|uniref:DUF3450 domain-containing protein n=1 Tax=Thalassotalea profundi TaxID=2036687 RepID=A0ABQ3IPW3_9GAMM|nr:DUF3450 domain-containing protein [Thalassotalea profundi]GHE87794.1 DUF3450 domain-containing protein [Thalassotalea profundi]